MKADEFIQHLAARARQEQLPHIDVADAVVAELHGQQAHSTQVSPMLVIALTSAVAASIVVTYAIQAWGAVQDPMASLLMSMNVVLQ